MQFKNMFEPARRLWPPKIRREWRKERAASAMSRSALSLSPLAAERCGQRPRERLHIRKRKTSIQAVEESRVFVGAILSFSSNARRAASISSGDVPGSPGRVDAVAIIGRGGCSGRIAFCRSAAPVIIPPGGKAQQHEPQNIHARGPGGFYGTQTLTLPKTAATGKSSAKLIAGPSVATPCIESHLRAGILVRM